MIASGNRVKPGQSDPRLLLVRKRLKQLGYLETAAGPGDGAPAFGSETNTGAAAGGPDVSRKMLDPDLAKALKAFQ